MPPPSKRRRGDPPELNKSMRTTRQTCTKKGDGEDKMPQEACGCFICGDGRKTKLLPDSRMNLFKGLVITPQFRKRLSPTTYTEFNENDRACSVCLKDVQRVWELDQKISELQREIEELVEKAREALKAKAEGKGATSTSTSKTVTATKATEDAAMRFEIKEEHEDEAPEDTDTILGGVDFPFDDDEDEVKQDGVGTADTEAGTSMNLRNKKGRQSKENALRVIKDVAAEMGHDGKEESDYQGTDTDDDDDANSNSEESDAEGKPTTIRRKKQKRSGKEEKVPDFRHWPKDYDGNTSCSKCGSTFTRFGRKILHEIVACGVQYEERQLLLWRIYVPTCAICGKQFKEQRDLKHHMGSHTGEKTIFRCVECNFERDNRRLVTSHQFKLGHKGITTSFCGPPKDENNETVALQDKAKTTVETSENVEVIPAEEAPSPYKCPHCRRRFKREFLLKCHILRHEERGPVRMLCEICGGDFKDIKGHVKRVHNDGRERKFGCPHPECNFKTFVKSDVNKHIRSVHEPKEGPQPTEAIFQCSLCPLKFITERKRLGHVRQAHTMPKKHACECGFRFLFLKDLLRHQATHNKQTFQCSNCKKKFERENFYAKHIQLCGVINPSFENQGTGKSGKGKGKRGKVTSPTKFRVYTRPTRSIKKKTPCPICGMEVTGKKAMYNHIRAEHPETPANFLESVANTKELCKPFVVRTSFKVKESSNPNDSNAQYHDDSNVAESNQLSQAHEDIGFDVSLEVGANEVI